jgi:hypothetical protein
LVVAADFFDSLIGKQISHVWRDHGSAIFLGFGELTHSIRRSGLPGTQPGRRPRTLWGRSRLLRLLRLHKLQHLFGGQRVAQVVEQITPELPGRSAKRPAHSCVVSR